MGQGLINLSDLQCEVNYFEYYDGEVVLRRGNMINVSKYINVESYPDKYEEFYVDELHAKSYIFSDSVKIINGWLLEDRLRNRFIYFSKEWILVKNTMSDEILIEISKTCGVDVFVYSFKCGFSEAFYDFENGIIFFTKRNILLHKDMKMMLNISTGELVRAK